jgi:succinoglycan biosynthesis transport protein ExoP
MSISQFLLILRSRAKLGLSILAICTSIALLLSIVLPKRYSAEATVVVDIRAADPIGGAVMQVSNVQSYMPTQVDIINSDRVAQKVVKMLKLDQSPVIKQQWLDATKGQGQLEVWLANLLQTKLVAKPARESNIITIGYSSADPAFSAAIANAFAQAYIDTNIELKVEPAKQYSKWFASQGTALRENLEKAQNRLSEYQQENGLIVTDERLDNETAKLNELSAQLTLIQTQNSDAKSKQMSGQQSENLPEVSQNSLIQNLKGDIARQEAKLEELAGNLGKNHPQYQRMASEIASLKQQLETEKGNITKGFSAVQGVGREKEANLKALIAAQKQKLYDLKQKRDEASVLLGEVSAAQKASESVAMRLSQSNLESQANQTNIAILTPATEPLTASSPRPVLFTLIGFVMGLVIGVIACFSAELSDRRIRSAEDLESSMLNLSVLAELQNNKKTKRFAWLLRRKVKNNNKSANSVAHGDLYHAK